jgi:hypothetical protein
MGKKAHRVTWEYFVGPIPEGFVLDHLCHNRSDCEAGNQCHHRRCCNPTHLEVVTPRQNGLTGKSFAAKGARQTQCKRGHDLTDLANLKPNSRGARQCRACANIARMDRYKRLGR